MADVQKESINFTVVIADPATPAGMSSDLIYKLTGHFYEHPTQYGNGYALTIIDDTRRFENVYDLRYDTTFNPNDKRGYLEKWARGYWTGKNGAYALKSITFKD